MAVTQEKRPSRSIGDASQQAVEAAVKRLTEAGLSRIEALRKIDTALYEVVAKLNSVGIGETARYRNMNIYAGKTLDDEQFAAAAGGGTGGE